MQRNLNLQPQEISNLGHTTELKKDSSDEMTRDWISAFNTSVLTTLSSNAKDRSLVLYKLMQSPEFASLLVGAQHLADAQNLSMEDATDRLIRAFREIDQIWQKIVIERGLKALID
jgi:hypothetical protein